MVKDLTNGKNSSITLRYFSPDYEENYSGDLSVEFIYTSSQENELIVDYQPTTTEDTVVNLTHHSYFNLDVRRTTIIEQGFTIYSYGILEANDQNIPTG